MGNIGKKDTQCFCINIRRASNSITSYYDNIMKPLDITITQFSMLSSISALKCCNTSELAAHMGLDRTSMVRNLKPLLKKELIIEEMENQRKKKIFLSPRGKKPFQRGESVGIMPKR